MRTAERANAVAKYLAVPRMSGRMWRKPTDAASVAHQPFAGGMRLGETCGAVTGAFMVLGLRHCSTDGGTPAGRSEVYARVVDFAGRFKQRNGSLTCRDLLGCDISTTEGMKQAQEQNLFKTTCVQMVRDAAEILEEMGSRQKPGGDGNTRASG